MYRKILQFPNKFLRKKTNLVEDFPGVQNIVKDLIDTCNVEMAIGLAANQIGYDKSIFVINKSKSGIDDSIEGCDLNPNFIVVCNPKMEYGKEEESWEEECLSLSGVSGKVTRKSEVKLNYVDHKGQSKSIDAKWPLAGVLQHEYDHLNGITYNFRMSRYPAQRLLKKLNKIRNPSGGKK